MEKRETDLRYRKTEKLIRRVFYEMIQEMDFEQITIQALARRAEINRKTFYLHYASLDGLLAELQIELIQPLIRASAVQRFPDDLEAAVRDWFGFSTSLGETEWKILCSRGNYPTGRDPWEYAIEHSGDFFACFSSHPDEKRLIAAYWCGSFRSVFTQWAMDGRTIPLDKIVRFFCHLMSKGLCNMDLELC